MKRVKRITFEKKLETREWEIQEQTGERYFVVWNGKKKILIELLD